MRKILNLNVLSVIKRRILNKGFIFITQNSMNLFLRGNDVISVGPQINGKHEEVLTKFIDDVARSGSSDFFIDIGANIGLSSCQNGAVFKKVVCFEPNPLCANILKTNLSITLDENSFEVFEFALGESEGSFDLYIPKHNWGGAFVRDSNGYSDEVLSHKDGFNSIDKNNYLVREVQVQKAETVFENLFSSLLAEGLRKGVVKIDVEGFESVFLLAISKTLPPFLEIVVLFENFDPKFDLIEIKKSFAERRVSCLRFDRSIMGTKKNIIRKVLEFVCYGENHSVVECVENEVVVGDVILEIV